MKKLIIALILVTLTSCSIGFYDPIPPPTYYRYRQHYDFRFYYHPYNPYHYRPHYHYRPRPNPPRHR